MIVNLCTECFSDGDNYETHTMIPIAGCAVCGRCDARADGGLRVNMFPRDPRLDPKNIADNPKIYALLVDHKEQGPLITKLCFGSCGKISIGGALMDPMLGGMFICTHEPCPHLKKQMDEPVGQHQWNNERGSTTYDVYLRMVQDGPAAAPATTTQ